MSDQEVFILFGLGCIALLEIFNIVDDHAKLLLRVHQLIVAGLIILGVVLS